ncbi:hypothetical protein [Aureimonas flava]|uniref:hypothetical protein n=1 Tax=Aureimonas flava TaxID=2320271 RepID=UPI0010A96F88|nr:hypothetical protein [Aureimonas flava]
MTVKLTREMRDALQEIATGEAKANQGALVSGYLRMKLKRDGLAEARGLKRQWQITPAGQAALLSPEAPASSKEEGE